MAADVIALSDLFNPAHLADLIDTGHIREQDHPTEPLKIYNYTEKTQYEQAWNTITRQCRGLIVHNDSHVIARPWPKFHNYGEHEAGTFNLTAPAEVTDKLDGSLAILHPAGDGYAIATRGSFTSAQAVHATRIWWHRYAEQFHPNPALTYLFEIVYPANRIVCDYGTLDDLVLLGAVHTATGTTLGPSIDPRWPGPRATLMPARTLAAALDLPPRPNAEGVVVRWPDTGHMLKIKQDDYVALHRIVTGLNARVVWERLGDGHTTADICGPLPDEFHSWVETVAADLTHRRDTLLAQITYEHQQILASLPEGWTRKDYAARAVQSPHKAWLFTLLDGRDPSPRIWRTLRPTGDERLTPAEEAA